MIFGAHGTEESARLDRPADVLDGEGSIVKGVALLGSDPYLFERLRNHLDPMGELDDLG